MKTAHERKADLFAKKYIANDMNGTKTQLEISGTNNRNSARVVASEKLAKPIYQNAVQDLLEKQVPRSKRVQLMQRNAEQTHTLPASNTAIDMMNKIAGDYAPDRHESINVTLSGKEAMDRLKEIDEELEKIRE